MLPVGIAISILYKLPLVALAMLIVFNAHELPDNRVEVGMDTVVMSDKIEISYSVAMNDSTMLLIEPSLKDIDDEDNENEDLVRQFGPLALARIGERIRVTADDKELVVKPVRWEVGARHPVRFICYYEVDLAEVAISDETTLQIDDRNYRNLEKQIAVALRAKEASALVSCDGAPLLVRADRKRLWELDSKEQLDAQLIHACVSLPADRPVADSTSTTIAPENASDQPVEDSDAFVPPISLLAGFCMLVLIIIGTVLVLRRK